MFQKRPLHIKESVKNVSARIFFVKNLKTLIFKSFHHHVFIQFSFNFLTTYVLRSRNCFVLVERMYELILIKREMELCAFWSCEHQQNT